MLELVPVTLREANGFVQQYHRHHKQVAGRKFSIGVAQDGKLVGWNGTAGASLKQKISTHMK